MAHKMTRREFIDRTAKAGIGVGVAGTLGYLAGCAKQPVAPTAAPVVAPTATPIPTKPPKAQVVTMDLANSFFTLNPMICSEIGGITVGNAVFSRVCRFTPEGKIVPELLEALPEMENSTTWVLKFIKGVKFHDGTELKASDFKFTIEWILNKENGSVFANVLNFIDSVQVVDDYTARVKLNRPFGLFPERMSIVKVVPEKKFLELGDRFNLEPVGSGPFMFKSRTANEKIELVRFPDYFKTGLPYLESLTYRWVVEDSVRMANIMAGQSDIIEQVPPQSFDTFGQIPGIKTGMTSGTRRTGFFMNCKKPPFDDVRVRQALSYAIDRKAIIDTVFKGHAHPGNGTNVPPSFADFNPNADRYQYDPEKAKALLKEAGKEGFKFELAAGSLKFLADTATLVKPMLEKIGLQPEIRLTEVESFYKYVFDRTYDTYITWGNTSAIGLDFGVHVQWMYSPLLSDGNIFGWGPHNGPAFEEAQKLMREAEAEADPAKRREINFKFQELVSENAVDFILYFMDNLSAWKEDVTGYVPPASDVVEAEEIRRV